jgi:hypothetical protein
MLNVVMVNVEAPFSTEGQKAIILSSLIFFLDYDAPLSESGNYTLKYFEAARMIASKDDYNIDIPGKPY